MSDHYHHNHNGSGFLNGLILGVLIGAGAVFFLGTKRGRELIDEITDKGLSLVGDFEDLLGGLEEDIVEEQNTPNLPSENIETPVEQPVDETPLQNESTPTSRSGHLLPAKGDKSQDDEMPLPVQSASPKETNYIAVASDITASQRMEEEQFMSSSASASDRPVPSHIERIQAHGRRFFHGIPKRR